MYTCFMPIKGCYKTKLIQLEEKQYPSGLLTRQSNYHCQADKNSAGKYKRKQVLAMKGKEWNYKAF